MAEIFYSSDSDDEILVDLFLRRRKEKKVRRRPDHLNDYDDGEFIERFRLTKDTVLHVLDMVNHQLEHRTERNNCVSPINQLLLTLRYLACGDFLICTGDLSGINKGTASRIVKRVSEAIASLAPRYIKFPRTQDEINRVQQGFYEMAAFPRVLGAIDCTHVKIKSPGGENAEDYRNRKGTFSFNVQTICNHRLQITDIVARWQGSTHDQTIFNNSAIKARFEQGHMGRSVLLGDSGYAATNYLLPPIPNPRTPAQNLYNESHVRTRNAVERSYGVLKRRFPVLAMGIRLKRDRVEAVIVACAVLHNIAIDMNDDLPPLNAELQNAFDEIEELRVENGNVGNLAVRDAFIQYFNSLL